MMGSTKSPDDGGAVAASIFVAVAVYAVSNYTKKTLSKHLVN
jgi:hypothetical protein